MLHKPSKTGVADYFAVLGIDSFLSGSNGNDVKHGEPGDLCDDAADAFTPKSTNLSTVGCAAAPSGQNVGAEEEDMRLRRFHREITQLALISSIKLEQTELEWTTCQHDEDGNKLHLYGAQLNIAGRECYNLELAYRTRGQYANVVSNSADEKYYQPAVADVSIHYVKVHPLSIPGYTYTNHEQQQPDETTSSQQRNESKLSSIAAAAVAAKTITSFARKTTVLGKEIVEEGLVSVVKNVRGAASGHAQVDSNSSIDHGVGKNESLYDLGRQEADNNAQNNPDVHRELSKNRISSRSGTREHFFPDTPAPKSRPVHESMASNAFQSTNNGVLCQPLAELLPLPPGYDEWTIPSFCQNVYLPTADQLKKIRQQKLNDLSQQSSSSGPILLDKTHVLPSPAEMKGFSSPSSMGVEAMYISPLTSPVDGKNELNTPRSNALQGESEAIPDSSVIPLLVPWKSVSSLHSDANGGEFLYIPIVAVRRQRIGEEERFHEDPAIVGIQLSRLDVNGMPPSMPDEEEDDDDNKNPMMQHGVHANILKQSSWTPSFNVTPQHRKSHPIILVRRNIPDGLADLPFAARVLDRFPKKNYRDMPFPEEELPMFCYARGSLLKRDKLRNLPMPKAFGFVVKNERGDSIYVSCLSFVEPLTRQRQSELDKISEKRWRVSLPHKLHCQQMQSKRPNSIFDKCHMVAFDDVITFESKTICLVGRYPYWTAFRQFLTHLHLLSGLSSDTPIERHISHLLLSVPIPKPGGQCVLVPMSTMREPMALLMPPLKDLPLLDLSFRMLFSALDVPTVVTIVLGFLCLEKKVILISTRQSLVIDCCELLKSLLFPFELCAPYVPHLTEPFMSCLEFPGATFVGIHDDGNSDGLANTVRAFIPEDSIIVELDSGEIKCDGNRYETLKAAYQIIPSDSRTLLIKEVESLCQDSGLVPGQEPLDYSPDSTIDSTVPSNLAKASRYSRATLPLDDRAVRDCFLRFFCSILGGYERFLVVPDADFLISGNEWFDSTSFLAAAPPTRNSYLSALVGTQLFQSFIQRRTEASDVHCVLFDECVIEYHSSKIPYGLRGNGDLLVDQCATEPDILNEEDNSFIAIEDKSFSQAGSDLSFDSGIPCVLNGSGDIVTVPSVLGLPSSSRFVYCVDGQPSFPRSLHHLHFLPKEPDHLSADLNESSPAPILTRSDREKEDSTRMLNSTISRRGPSQKQHRCLWQLPKFMGSQFLGVWLMCIPSQLCQPNFSINDKSQVLLRALGAFRTLRSHRRIICDEAGYRALIVACGKCGTDRRTELMKLYSLMRNDSIFPNAVTLGQYTKAIAECYSSKDGKVGMQISVNAPRAKAPFVISTLDRTLQLLEESGQKWMSQGNTSQVQGPLPRGTEAIGSSLTDEKSCKPVISPTKTFDTATTTQRQTKHKRMWLPIACSSSFQAANNDVCSDTNPTVLVALWSRTVSCDSCRYIPLDEEVQCGWDVVHSAEERNPSIACPRCGSPINPLIGFKCIELPEALESTGSDQHCSENELNLSRESTANDLPPQLEERIQDWQSPSISIDHQAEEGYVSYLSPYQLRLMLEQLVEEYGEEVLRRDRLLAIDPQIFYNFWWYCARFDLPLPLAVATQDLSVESLHGDCCAFASWDKRVAIHGCQSAAKAIVAAKSLHDKPDRALREKLFDNPATDMPILSFFNFQNYAQSDWDHPDLQEILVALVKACETRDLLPVIECVYERNLLRNENQDAAKKKNTHGVLNSSYESAFSVGESSTGQPTNDLDCYRTLLYLARYQCMTAFHAFFPTTTKACRGYHFWCPSTPWSIFDRAFGEAAKEYGKKHKMIVTIPDVSDVAIGFRSIFGQVV